MKLYIDIDKAPSGLVTSTVNTALVKAQPVFVQGDTIALEIYLLSNYSSTTGNYTPVSLTGCTLRVGLGTPGDVIAYADTFEIADGAAKMSLSLNTVEAGEALEGKSAISTLLEVEYITAQGVRQTVLQIQAVLKNDILATDTPEPVEIPLAATILTQAAAARDAAQGFAAEAEGSASGAEYYANQAGEHADDAHDSELAAAASKDATETLKGQTQTLHDDVSDMRDEVESNKQATETLAGQAADSAEAAEDSRVRAVDAVAAFGDSYRMRGTWGSSSTPTSPQAGDWWLITAACIFSGISWAANDRALWTGTAWQKLSAEDAYKAERDARKESVGNKLSANALELTSGYVTIPGSATPMAKLPLTYCFTYTKRSAWGTNDMVISNTKTYTRASYTPKAGIYLGVQSAENRTILAVQLNSPSVDGDSMSLHTWDMLPLGTHSVCIVITDTFSDGTKTSTSLPQKIALYVDGVQWTPVVKSGYSAPEIRKSATTGGTTLGTCNYYGDAPPADFVFSGYSEQIASALYRINISVSRLVIFNCALPATAAAAIASYRYSVEQYALGEAIPDALVSRKTSAVLMSDANINARTFLNIAGLTATLTPSGSQSYSLHADFPQFRMGEFAHIRVTLDFDFGTDTNGITVNFSTRVTVTNRLINAVIYKDGVLWATTNSIIASKMPAGVYDFYIANTLDGYTGAYFGLGAGIYTPSTGGTYTINLIETLGAIVCLDQPFKGGNQLPDRGIFKLPGVVESQQPALRELTTYRATLSWLNTFDAKALVSATTNVIPANTRVVLYAKASTGTPTVAVANGSTTLTAAAALSTSWQEVGSYYYAAAAKLTVQPSVAYMGDIYIMARLEPLTL